MSEIRPFVQEDIPAAADLHARVFPVTHFTPDELRAYFKLVFFQNPWFDLELPSLVYQEADRSITGFLGVVPRRMQMGGRPIRVAVSCQFMVSPISRSRLIGVELMRKFFSGLQDLSLTDGANDTSRRIWETLGGATALGHSIHWTRPLLPGKYFQFLLKQRGVSAPINFLLNSVFDIVDALAIRIPRSPFRIKLQAPEQDLDVDTLLQHLSEFSIRESLLPEYDSRTLNWLLNEVAQRKYYGNFRKIVVRGASGKVIGWYLYYLKPNGISEVLQVVSNRDSIVDVLDHLSYHALRQGSFAIGGRLDPRFIDEFTSRRYLIQLGGPWVLVHSKDPNLLHSILRGDAFLSRLEAEWWMRFLEG